MTRELEPEARDLIREIEAQGALPPYALSVEHAREALEDRLVGRGDPPRNVGTRDIEIPGPAEPIPLRIYDPVDDPHDLLPVLVYYHGGGWVRGSLETHDELCRSLAARADCLVVSPDYRRAPEHPFPAAVEDAYATVAWVATHVAALGGDADRLAVGGDSAGGNLAAAVSLAARDRDGPSLVHQLLVYPVTDHAFDTDSYEENAEGYLLTRRSMRWYWDQYLGRTLDGRHPYASPLQARDLHDLPPATVITAGFDPLRDEGQAYADRLRDHDVPVTSTEFPGMIHGFVSFPELDGASEARTELVESLVGAFDSTG